MKSLSEHLATCFTCQKAQRMGDTSLYCAWFIGQTKAYAVKDPHAIAAEFQAQRRRIGGPQELTTMEYRDGAYHLHSHVPVVSVSRHSEKPESWVLEHIERYRHQADWDGRLYVNGTDLKVGQRFRYAYDGTWKGVWEVKEKVARGAVVFSRANPGQHGHLFETECVFLIQ